MDEKANAALQSGGQGLSCAAKVVFKKDVSRIDLSVRAALNGFSCGVHQAPGQPAPRV
ncbi:MULTISPECIES: hypothetical protein [Paraburkholderia]|uniref:hypothetical protein n=1 Tax=Paraburkholderia TaxID=1822464 RepID=UPI0038B944F7